MIPSERSQEGWKRLAEVMELSERSAMKYRNELHADGVIWYGKSQRQNVNGKRIKGQVVRFYESKVKEWMFLKIARNEWGSIPRWKKAQ